jgi:hypothetical protein
MSDEQLNNLKSKISSQNENIKNLTENHKNQMDKIYDEISLELKNFEQILTRISLINPHSSTNPLAIGVNSKIDEFNRLIQNNNIIIKKNKENIPEIQRKKKENDDFFVKFVGEKKVWLDRLNEDKFRDIAYSNGFQYFYEAKTIKLLMEGILLEKVQEKIDKELTIKGEFFGWNVMDIEKENEKRKKDEFDLNVQLLDQNDQNYINQKENEFKENWEKNEEENNKKREEINIIWKKLWQELWMPKIPLSTDQTLVKQRELIKQVTMQVTFDLYKKLLFDIWKFKNIIHNSDEYVVLDKVRKYFPDDNSNPNKDEEILNKMMNIIEEIKQEEEIIYCDLNPARNKLQEYINNNSKNKNNNSIERLKNVIEKISKLQNDLMYNPSKLIKIEVEEINDLIKAIPDEKEKKLFRDNLKEESRLYDVFLPLTTLLQVVAYISIGKKRTKNYEKRLNNYKNENEEKTLKNKEYEGKLNMLNEVKEKNKEDVFEINEDENVINTNNNNVYDGDIKLERENIKKAKEELKKNFDEMNKIKDVIKNNQNKFFNEINENLLQI